ncbi:putative sporulation protein rmd8 protein [Botrytis fragariae]|uniref:Putative sporulation protein rmd8 protein n=1 Tax=Botrytis fragariae TaxID=1964551 RepID=A0A8H6AJM6_9HELO|nr:putative sporulation protein rmd8 protein [Botrytis fragariae]KAF5868867.1 putative sporulation protein rmd8 protein [Botrytis fragariae]
MASPAGKRGPSVLVTDSRERQRPSTARNNSQRPNANGSNAPRPTRFISVDNVLQYASQIPSGQARGPPAGRKPQALDQRRANGPISARIAQQNVPGRSTKISEKLVLIPDTVDEKDDSETEEILGAGNQQRLDGGGGPPTDAERDILKREASYAERLPKARRANELARVTAYCTAQAYKTKATAAFVKERHGAKTKLYDDCLYTVYHLPLLPGTEGFRVRSSPVLKSPGGKAVLDEEIERSENRDYHEGYFEDTDTYGVRGGEDSPRNETDEERIIREEGARRGREETHIFEQGKRADSPNRVAPDAKTFAEMFVFSYGVVVFWNFTEHQEKDILADLTFAAHNTDVSLVVRPQEEEDLETEELHFEYNSFVDRPRIFNDMITLRSGDHMIKLAMSHAIAQSTKLSFFEERMSQTMLSAEHIPKHLALTGQLGMSRTEILKILGRLFKSRVDVNLSSNILDVPSFFWDSEPTLHPLYEAIREYLEIGPRITTLNERCRVFLDLAEVLSDSIADTKMSTITWIVIILIIISIAVTVTEVGLRFIILEKAGSNGEILQREWLLWIEIGRDLILLEAICGVGHTITEL